MPEVGELENGACILLFVCEDLQKLQFIRVSDHAVRTLWKLSRVPDSIPARMTTVVGA